MVKVGKSWRRLKVGDRLRDIFRSQPVVDGIPGSSRVALVLLLSGLFGFCLGMFGNATWQDPVETAQVISGIVEYPRQNPFYMYHIKLWTFSTQISALLLHFGASERALSLVVSGVMGMLSFQALSVCVLAICHDSLLAIASPFFIHFTNAASFGIIYPVWLMGHPQSYGVLGLSFILLVIGLIGTGQYKLGGLFLGIAPAVHPSLGILCFLIVLICFVWDFRYLCNPFRKAARYFLLGCTISGFSFAFQLFMSRDLPKVAPEVMSEYLVAFVQYWDAHRRPVDFHSLGMYLTIASLLMSFLWLLPFKRDVPRHTLFLFRVFVVSAVLGLGFIILSWLPSQMVPDVLLIMMPARLLNLNVLGFMALLMGLLGGYKSNFWVQLNLTTLIVVLVVLRLFAPGGIGVFGTMLVPSLALAVILILRARWSGHLNELHRRFELILGVLPASLALIGIAMLAIAPAADWLGIGGQPGFGQKQTLLAIAGSLVLLAALGLLCALKKDVGFLRRVLKVNSEYFSENRWLLNGLRGVVMLVLGLIMIETGINVHSAWKATGYTIRDRTNDPLFAEAAKGQGMLLTCSNLRLIQLRTRRPVLLNGESLDSLPYAPESGPEMNRILQQVYGVDLLNPPEEIKNARPGGLLRATGKALWESRTPEQWREIGKGFGVTNIICYEDWKLQLPEVIRDNQFALYGIP